MPCTTTSMSCHLHALPPPCSATSTPYHVCLVIPHITNRCKEKWRNLILSCQNTETYRASWCLFLICPTETRAAVEFLLRAAVQLRIIDPHDPRVQINRDGALVCLRAWLQICTELLAGGWDGWFVFVWLKKTSRSRVQILCCFVFAVVSVAEWCHALCHHIQ